MHTLWVQCIFGLIVQHEYFILVWVYQNWMTSGMFKRRFYKIKEIAHANLTSEDSQREGDILRQTEMTLVMYGEGKYDIPLKYVIESPLGI